VIERYRIWCQTCYADVWLVQDSDNDFHCPRCNTYYSSEDGIQDWLIAYEHYLIYRGAKLAGLIKEPDVPREQYRSEWRD
jgi:hypothetical protein